MIYIFKNIFCLYILLDMLNGYEHILDKSSVRDGDRFSISCSLKLALSGRTFSGAVKSVSISRLSSNGSYEVIVKCALFTVTKKDNFNRPWNFKGLENCVKNMSDLCIEVEVTDAKCSDATQYKCHGAYLSESKTLETSEHLEELKRDASCDKMEVSTPAGGHINTPKMNYAHQEPAPMRWRLVVGAIITAIGVLAK